MVMGESSSPKRVSFYMSAIGASITLVLSLIMLVPAAPLFIKLFISFPSLEDTIHLVGTVKTRPGKPLFSRAEVKNRYFVVTKDGEHEVSDGYFGDRFPPHHAEHLDGAQGELWYHPAFGIVQQNLSYLSGSGEIRVSRSTIEGTKKWHEEAFRWSRYLWRMLTPILLVSLFWLQFRQLRKALIERA